MVICFVHVIAKKYVVDATSEITGVGGVICVPRF